MSIPDHIIEAHLRTTNDKLRGLLKTNVAQRIEITDERVSRLEKLPKRTPKELVTDIKSLIDAAISEREAMVEYINFLKDPDGKSDNRSDDARGNRYPRSVT